MYKTLFYGYLDYYFPSIIVVALIVIFIIIFILISNVIIFPTQDLRVFCSEVVGMLREKKDMISQLQTVTLHTLEIKKKMICKRRIEEDEDMIYSMKEVDLCCFCFDFDAVLSTINT